MNVTEAATLARKLMNEHELRDWTFEYDNAKRRFGICKHGRRTISLSRYLVRLNDEDKVRDTILHEIAHALCGPRIGHGRAWRVKCMEIGAKPERCYDATNDDVEQPPHRYEGRCPICGHTYHRLRLRERTKNEAACKPCYDRTGQYILVEWFDLVMGDRVPA